MSLGIETGDIIDKPRKVNNRLMNQSMDLSLENSSAHRRYQSLRASLNTFTPSAIRTNARHVNYQSNTVNKSLAFRTIDAGMPRRLAADNTSPKLMGSNKNREMKTSRINKSNILPAIGSTNTNVRDNSKDLHEEVSDGDLITIDLDKANLQVP